MNEPSAPRPVTAQRALGSAPGGETASQLTRTPSSDAIDGVVARVWHGERVWARTSLVERRRLLLQVSQAVAANAAEWVRIAADIKGLEAPSPLVGEEWFGGPYAVISYCQALGETLHHLAEGVDPLVRHPTKPAPGGRLAIQVLPHSRFDRLLFNGFTAEVWTRPGVSRQELSDRAGLAQRHPEETGGVALVLGAGNVFSIAVLDVLYQLYAENRTVVLKLNPVTDPLLDVYRTVFQPLIDLAAVEIVTGGPEVGAALTQHPGIDAVHMTGSEATHDAIVWGTSDQGVAAKTTRTPRLDKPITSELGGVCPVIVVPGRWSKADLRYQAEHVATQRLHNSGSNCVAAQIVVLSADWPQKKAFLDAVRHAVANAPSRPGWYPGCDDRLSAAQDLHPQAENLGHPHARVVMTGLDLGDADESAFTTEYFGPVLGVTELPGTGADFLDAAVEAVNERLHGTLGANIIAHPGTIKQLGDRFSAAIEALRYGTTGINTWTALGYLTPRATWGAFPGHTLGDVQSGIGIVHNALLLADVERTVVTGPFRSAPRSLLSGEWSLFPRPPWFLTNRTAARTGRLLTRFAARPHWAAVPAIVASTFRG